MRAALLLAAVVAASAASAEGDLRFRLQRRFPECRGVIENFYAGDEFDLYSRVRFTAGDLGFVIITDKARGEEWGDTAAGGGIWSPDVGPVRSVSAGFLRACLGGGLVLSSPGNFADVGQLSLYKPPGIRGLLEPAISPWGCRATPLTGAGARFSFSQFSISVLASVSPIDSLSGGYHRTPSEIAGRFAFTETLAAARVSTGGLGLTAAAAVESRQQEYRWIRCGADWELGTDRLGLTGEVALSTDSSATSFAGWGCISQMLGGFRHMLMLLRNPSDFSAERSSPPVSRECDLGVSYGLRWRLLPSMALRWGTGAYFAEDDDVLITSAEVQYRFPWSMETAMGIRTRAEDDCVSWRGWLSGTWKPMDRFSIRSKLQLSGWSDSGGDSTESGSGLEIKFRYSPEQWLQIDCGAAASSTDGYNSRIYAGGSSFPGVFGSTALYGRSLLMFLQMSVELDRRLYLRSALGRLVMEGADTMGSGWEETEGSGRTQLGLQLDYAFQ